MFEDIFSDIETDAELWVALRDMIQASLAILPHVAAKPRIAFPGPFTDRENIRRAKSLAIEAFAKPKEEAARALLRAVQERAWPPIGNEAAYHLTIALEQIVRFLDLSFVPDTPKAVSVFRCPGTNLAQLALWFYIRWWLDVGIYRWLDDVSRDETTFYLYFERPTPNDS